MKKYAQLSFGELCDKLAEKKSTLILFHVRPDGDSVGSALALKILLKMSGSRAWCVCANEIPQRLKFLSEDVQESALLESVPDGFSYERVITVDTASASQLGALYEKFEDKIDFMIDHHAKGEPYADHYVASDASAAGEIIFDISREFLKRGIVEEIPKKVDFCIYAAISSDTGCFKYPNVTAKTHICSAELMSSEIDTAEINRLLFDSKSMEVLAAEKAGFDTIRMFHNGKIAVVFFTYDMKMELGVLDEHLETLIDVARSVEGVEVAVAIRQPNAEKSFRVSTRSANSVDVSAVCAYFGGGGHIRAAGCTIVADSIWHVADLVVGEIEKQMY